MTKATLAAAVLAALTLIATPASANVDCDATPDTPYCSGPSEGTIRLVSGCVEGGPSHEVTGYGDPGDPVTVNVDGEPAIRSTVDPFGMFFARIRVPNGATVTVNGAEYLPDLDCTPLTPTSTDDVSATGSGDPELAATGTSWVAWLMVAIALMGSGTVLARVPQGG